MSRMRLRKSLLFATMETSLLSWIKANLDPLFLLCFDDAPGSTVFADSSGNGNDFTIQGTPTLQAGEDTLLSEAGQSMDITGTAQKGTRDSVATTGDNWTVLCIYTADTANTLLRIYDNILDSGASTARCTMYNRLGVMRMDWPSAFISITARSINAVGWNGMLGVSAFGTEGAFFENGLEFSRFTVATGAILGGALRTDGWGDYPLSNANPAYGKHRLGLLADKAMTRLDHYELFQQATGGRVHYWYETLGSLSGATPATATSPALPPASCVFHAPLWEEAGAQAIDVSGNENHGTFVGGPTLGQPPLGDNAVYSVALNGSTQYLDATAALVDASATSLTGSMRFTSTNGSHCGIWGLTSTFTNYLIIWLDTTTGFLKMQIHVGAGPQVLTSNSGVDLRDGLVHNIAWRWNQATKHMQIWEDGVSVGTKTSLHVPATATLMTFGSIGHVSLFKLIGKLEVPALFDVALSDADCVILSGG